MKKLIISLFVLHSFVFSQTNVSGVISSNTTWTLANSPYIVTGNILINQNVTLTIEAGVNVQFDSDKVFQVKGELIAQGTNTSKITFTSNASNPTAGDWASIQFLEETTDATFSGSSYTSGSIMEYCIVEYAENLYIYRSRPFINYSEFRYNGDGSTSGYDGGYGIFLNGGNPKITKFEDSVFTGNYRVGNITKDFLKNLENSRSNLTK